MVFSSLDFLFGFLPIFLLIYASVPDKWKNLVLLLGSLGFYAYGAKEQPFSLLLILFSFFMNHQLAILIEEMELKFHKKLVLGFSILLNFGCLFFCKYWMMPLGFSFYTFQITAYLIDVYRGEIAAEPSVLYLGNFMYAFPQVTAGPILRYPKLKEQLRNPAFSMGETEEGLKEFTIGLGLKVLLSNQMAGLWKQVNVIGFDSISTPLAWLGLLAYSLEIYFDFYGYSLMAVGLGRVLGFKLPENFRQPYTAVSMSEFWRRWHISLGAWFRDYVYIPLGGSRCNLWKYARNLLLVWLFTSLWHGIGWNFLLWGGSICLLIFLEKCFWGEFLKKHRIFGHIYLCFFVALTWLFFAVGDLGDIWVYLTRLFPFLGGAKGVIFASDYVKYAKMYVNSLVIGIFICTGIPRKFYERYKEHMFMAILLLAIFWACISCIWVGMDDPFLYFSF